MKTIFFGIIAITAATIVLPAHGQEKSKRDKNDAAVTIRVNGKEQDIETYFENWGEEFGRKMELMFDDPKIHIDLDEEDIEINLDGLGIEISDLAESISETVTEAVANMTITLKDIDPDDIDKNDCHFSGSNDLREALDEIEQDNGSRVKNIDTMKIKIREHHVKIDMALTLENGKKIQTATFIKN